MTPLQLVLAFFPPDLRPAYLLALVQPVAETVGLAFGAMFLAFCLSLPLGVIAALNLRGARGLLLALGALRAVPDLTLAILCVILFGVGPGAGLAALVIYYAAGMAKMFADLLRTAPQAPLRALRAAGASRLQTALFGLLPLKRADLLAFGAYEFECALRASVIVGAVGGGGLGAELMGALSAMDFHRAATLILALVLLAAVFDALPIGFAGGRAGCWRWRRWAWRRRSPTRRGWSRWSTPPTSWPRCGRRSCRRTAGRRCRSGSSRRSGWRAPAPAARFSPLWFSARQARATCRPPGWPGRCGG